jgi:hypothetical protein
MLMVELRVLVYLLFFEAELTLFPSIFKHILILNVETLNYRGGAHILLYKLSHITYRYNKNNVTQSTNTAR